MSATVHRYRHGPGTAIVTDRGALLALAPTDDPAVLAIERCLTGESTFDGAISALSAIGFSALPLFGLAIRDATAVRILQRRGTAISVTAPDGSMTELAPPNVTSWREDAFDDVSAIRLVIVDAELGHESWLLGGVVAAGVVNWIADTDGAAPQQPAAGRSTWSHPSGASAEEPVLPDALPHPSVNGIDAENERMHLEVADLDFGNLIGHTVYHRVEDAAVRTGVPDDDADLLERLTESQGGALAYGEGEAEAEPSSLIAAGPEAYEPGDDDHDGHTVARRPIRRAAATDSPSSSVGRRLVSAVSCAAGHPNPVNAPNCRRCGQPILDRSPSQIPQPEVGVLRFSTNDVIALDRAIVIGRVAPADGDISGATATVVIDNTELSRVHATVAVDEWTVQVTDHDSTNGTSVIVPGQPEQRCRPNQPVPISPGTVVNLGGVATFRFDVE